MRLVVASTHTYGSFLPNRRLICWNMEEEKLLWKCSMDAKVTSVEHHPGNSQILLLLQASKEQPLYLFDRRTEKVMLSLSWRKPLSQSPSQFIYPCWAPNGNLISCGSTERCINLWDIRYDNPLRNQSSDHLQVFGGGCAILQDRCAWYALSDRSYSRSNLFLSRGSCVESTLCA